MKIVYFCNSLSGMGGIERVVTAKMNHLCNYHDIVLLTTNQKRTDYFYHLDKRIKHIDIGSYGIYRYILFHRKRFQKLLKDIDPDVIVAVTGVESLLLPFLDTEIPKIKEMHFSKDYRVIQNRKSNIVKRFAVWFMGKVEEQIYSMYDVVTPLTYEDAKKWNLNNMQVIYNFKTIVSQEVASLRDKVVISVGRIDYQKGYDILLDAWSEVVKIHPDWRLKIYGEGKCRENLQKLAKKLGIFDSVCFCGGVKDIKTYYLKSAIYVMSSRHEGFPLVLTEAMECGLPVVSFDCPSGPAEIVDDGVNGYLVENGDDKMLAERIIRLIEDEDLRKKMAAEARKKARKFEKDHIMKEWINLFEKMIPKRKNAK